MGTATRRREARDARGPARWAVAAVALTCLGLSVMAAPGAQAAGPLPAPTDTGSITVYKYRAPHVPDGLLTGRSQVDTPERVPMPGVALQVRQVMGIDLSTLAGWQAARDVVYAFDPARAGFPPAPFTLGQTRSRVTGSNGAALFADLPIGVYLVAEDGPGEVSTVPFVVTVPMTDPDNDGAWIWHVHAYPKTQTPTSTPSPSGQGPVLTLAKTNHRDTVTPGQRVTWDVTVTNTGPVTATDVSVVDTLPAGTTFVSASDGGRLSGNEVTWTIGDLPAGQSRTLKITLTVSSNAGDRVTNLVRATATNKSGVTHAAARDTDRIEAAPGTAPDQGNLAVTGAAQASAVALAAFWLVGVGVVVVRRRRSSLAEAITRR